MIFDNLEVLQEWHLAESAFGGFSQDSFLSLDWNERYSSRFAFAGGLDLVANMNRQFSKPTGFPSVEKERSINVAKLLRAYGGCLGIRRRGRAWKSAKSPGELTNK